MKKRITSIVLAIVMVWSILLSTFTVGALEKTPLTMTPDKTEVHPGDTITYTVKMGAVTDLAGMLIGLNIPEGLTYVSGQAADGIQQTLQAAAAEYVDETRKFIVGSANYTGTETIELFSFTCTVDEGASGNLEITFDIDPDNLIDSNYENIPFDYSDPKSEIHVTPRPVPATGITLNKASTTIYTGNSETLKATVEPADSTDVVTWKSNNGSVASVENGKVTAVAPGTATITASAGNYTATCVVTVEDAPCLHPNKTTISEKESTCIEQGWDEYSECDDCGQLFDASGREISEVPYRELSDHTYGNLIAEVPAECEVEGMEAHYICSVCNGYFDSDKNPTTKEDLVIPALNHDLGEWQTDGENHWQVCSVCGLELNKGTHTGGEATCTDKAVCEVCGNAYGELNPDNHKNTEVRDAEEATCVDDGYTGDIYCKDCGIMLQTGSVIAATGEHSYVWVIDKEATATTEGSKHEECTVCGDKKDAVVIPATGVEDSDNNSNTDDVQSDEVEGPQTGESDHLILWTSLFLISAGAFVGLYARTKKRNSSR